MKKNFIKVSVICALTLASSTAVVSCSDYDDDIKNHQEQIDALKKQLDASKTEITEGLNTAIEGLKAEITEIAGSKADAASVKALEQKAAELQQALDSKASNEQIAALSEEVKGLINDVNTELSAAMEETKTSLEGQISTLQQKQDELNKKIEGLDNSEEIATIQSELDKVTSDLAKAQNDLKTILDANYGQKIAELQTKVTNLEGLEVQVNAYTDEQIKTLDTKLTGEITAAIADVKALIPEDLAGKLTSLENKFADYVTVNQLKEVTDMIGDLSLLEGETLVAVLNDKADASALTDVSNRVTELEKEFKEGGSIETIKTSIETLREDVKKILGVMVQSIMYVPQFDSNMNPTNIEFKTLYARPASGNDAKVADNVTSKVQFRVTPASAAASFNENYKIAFEGKFIGNTRSALPEYLSYEYVKNEAAEAEGIVTFNVSRNANFGDKQAYALCAHISGINAEGKTENLTDISSNFFVASHSNIVIKDIDVVAPNFDNSEKTVAWNKVDEPFITPGTVTLKGITTTGGTIEDLAKDFGTDKFNVSFALTGTGANAFSIDSKTGAVKVKSKTSSAIDSKAGVKAIATTAGVSYTTNYQTTFRITKDIKTYSEDVTVKWTDIAVRNITVDLLDATHKTKIADAFGISINDWTNIVNTAQITEDLGNSLSGVSMDTNGRLVLTINQLTHIATDKVVTITLKDNTSETTQSSSEYEIKLTIKKTEYFDEANKPKLTPQEAVWNEAKDKVILTPTFAMNNGKVKSMNLSVDVTSIYQNFDSDINKIKNEKYAYVTIQAPTNSVAGVSPVNYNSTSNPSSKTLTIDQTQYAGGAEIKAITEIAYNNDQVVSTKAFTFGVQQLSGTFVNNAPAEVKFSTKNESKQLTGLSWKDYLNRAMWIDGKKQIYNAQSMPNAAFAKDPFSNDIYAMTNCVPVYSIEQSNDYLKVDPNTGVITLTQSGKDKVFTGNYTAKLIVTINQPRWGAINGLGTATNGQYKLTFNVVIPAGIQ